jgi:hypothetical protein
MKSKFSVLIVLCLLFAGFANAQEKSKKQIKEEKKLALQKEVEKLVNSKEFIFIGETAFPAGYRSVTLSPNSNYVRFHPENIESYMPYYGRTYNAGASMNDPGLKFEGNPTEYTLKTTKKDHRINAVVKGPSDNYTISLIVSFDSSASLSITSNNRNSISYNGQIYPYPDQTEAK